MNGQKVWDIHIIQLVQIGYLIKAILLLIETYFFDILETVIDYFRK